MKRTTLALALACALPASAVTLNPDGVGQALIYPYYTVQSSGGDAFNTYLSVVNHTAQAKALRVRFREGRLGKETLSLNLYLSPNDVWTGAVVPFSTGTRLVSTDFSCTEPRFAQDFAPGELPFMDFRNAAFSGANDDGAGTGLDRTREGFIEIIEMATLTGASAAAATHNSAGVPANCLALLTGTPSVAAPTGGLSGTLTLINVASGMDFNVNAEALDQLSLSQRPFFRPASDPYPDFNAAEIDPISIVTANAATYRSLWSRPVDAVSAVLMREHAFTEYVLDQPTASLTDVVITAPTRHFYVSPTAAAAPFTAPAQWAANCASDAAGRFGEPIDVSFWNREEASPLNGSSAIGVLPPIPPRPALCASSAVSTLRNAALVQTPRTAGATPVLGSVAGGLTGEGINTGAVVFVTASTRFQSGWIDFRMPPAAAIASTGDSSTVEHGSGARTVGVHTFRGLPVVGFGVRIFRNGTLRCDAGSCQGNYGGAFPLRYRRNITPSG